MIDQNKYIVKINSIFFSGFFGRYSKPKLKILFCTIFLWKNFFVKNMGKGGEWSGGQISWDQNRRSNDFLIMRSNYFGSFHEVEIPNNDLISWLWHFSGNQNLKKHH
jgi:hypothetical protein